MEMDVVVPGGGFALFGMYGAIATLYQLQRCEKCRVRRFYATSAGAILACIYICFDERRRVEVVEAFPLHAYECRYGWIVDGVRSFLELWLPPDAHLLCSGTLWVSYNEQWTSRVVSEYAARADLIDAIIESSSYPGYCASPLAVFGKWDGMVPHIPAEPREERVPLIHLEQFTYVEVLAATHPFCWYTTGMVPEPFDSVKRALRGSFSRIQELERVLPFCGVTVQEVRAAAEAAEDAFYAGRVGGEAGGP
jgi:hypothetical protein